MTTPPVTPENTDPRPDGGISRRRFVQATGAGVAAASLAAPLLARPRRHADTIRIGVIGCGGRGT